MSDSDTSVSAQANALSKPEQTSPFGIAHTIGRTIWELTGRSIRRLVLTFVAVFLAGFLPSLLITLFSTVASQTYTRGGLFVLILLCMIPIAAITAFNRVAYLGLRDVVRELGLGQQLGAAFVAYIDPSDRMRMPLTDFTRRLKQFTTTARREAREEFHGLRGMPLRIVNVSVFYCASFVIRRIAKGCVVDGEVDLERLAIAIGQRADDMLIAYFKSVLWDLTRLVVSAAILLLWILLYVVITLMGWLS